MNSKNNNTNNSVLFINILKKQQFFHKYTIEKFVIYSVKTNK